MRPTRLATLALTVVVLACSDATLPVRIGISQEGGAARHTLAFVVQPAGAAAGDIITPAIQVAARDTLGNTDPTFAANVTIRLRANPTGGFLGGTATVASVFGVANFGNLTVSAPGSGYTLVATAPGAAAAVSAGFTIAEARTP
jgi:hypothetical protein